jgi:hypothetical protein
MEEEAGVNWRVQRLLVYIFRVCAGGRDLLVTWEGSGLIVERIY